MDTYRDPPPPRSTWGEGITDATRHMFDVSRWLVGVIGAAVAAVLAGTDLSGLGGLGPDDRRYWAAVAGGVFAASGFGAALWSVLRVGAGEVNLEQLSADEMAYAHDWGFFRNRHTGQGFFATGQEFTMYRAFLLYLLDGVTTPPLHELVLPPGWSLADRAGFLRARLTDMAWEVHDVVLLIENRRVQRRYKVARRMVLVGGAVAAVGTLILIWSANVAEPAPVFRLVVPTAEPAATPNA